MDKKNEQKTYNSMWLAIPVSFRHFRVNQGARVKNRDFPFASPFQTGTKGIRSSVEQS
jgi:frataxin-like iron-binding protein CyaY